MKGAGMFMATAVAALAMGCAGSKTTTSRAPQSPADFAGAWHVDWCEAGQPRACGGFTAYFVQQRGSLCGSHVGMDARGNRMDEGEPASITGAVDHDVANIEVRSARNHGVYRARIVRVADGLSWTNGAEVRAGDNGEPALIPDADVLRPARDAESARNLDAVRRQCAEVRTR